MCDLKDRKEWRVKSSANAWMGLDVIDKRSLMMSRKCSGEITEPWGMTESMGWGIQKSYNTGRDGESGEEVVIPSLDIYRRWSQ